VRTCADRAGDARMYGFRGQEPAVHSAPAESVMHWRSGREVRGHFSFKRFDGVGGTMKGSVLRKGTPQRSLK
jgi:hypothetical protein